SLVLGVLARRAGTTAVVPARDFRGGLLLLSRGRALLSQGGALLSRGCLLSRGRLLVQIVVRPELRAGDVGRRHQAFVADLVELLGVRLLFEQLLQRLVGARRELGLVLRDLVRGGLVLALLYRERGARAERR